MFRFYQTPGIFRLLSKDLLWRIHTNEKEIYLTFDDGPIPELTEYVLDQLDQFNAKATFFCVGDNIRKHPKIFQKVLDHGHEVGNHTFNHLKAWSTRSDHYLNNIRKCQETINQWSKEKGKPLLRPPHGQISKRLIKELKHKFRIVMWDILTYDFSNKQNPEVGLRKSIQKTTSGSIVVFHDNYKAEKNLKYMLPRYLKHFTQLGYQFKKI